MLIDWPREFDNWLTTIESQGGPALHATTAMLRKLEALPKKPPDETPTFKRVRQARHYDLWRVAHPYHPATAIRFIIWFPDEDHVVLALVGFDKARHGDIWYASAAIRAESTVDQWLRNREVGTR